MGHITKLLAKIAQRAKNSLKNIGMKHKDLLITRFGFIQGFIQYLSRRKFSLFKVSIPTREQKNIHYIETFESEYFDISRAIFWLSIFIAVNLQKSLTDILLSQACLRAASFFDFCNHQTNEIKVYKSITI